MGIEVIEDNDKNEKKEKKDKKNDDNNEKKKSKDKKKTNYIRRYETKPSGNKLNFEIKFLSVLKN